MEEVEQLKSGSNHRGGRAWAPRFIYSLPLLPSLHQVCAAHRCRARPAPQTSDRATQAWRSLPGGTVPVRREAGARGQAGASPPVGPLYSHSRDSLIQGVHDPGLSGLAAAFPWRVLSEPAWKPLPGWGLHVTRLETWNCPKVPVGRELQPSQK